IRQLCDADRHRAVRHRWPQKAPALQSLREQARALAIMPNDRDQVTATAAKDEQIAVVRVALQCLLHEKRKAWKSASHVGMARGKPNAHVAWNRDHRRSSTVRTRARAAASTPLSTITRRPCVSTISIRPTAATGYDEEGEFSAASKRPGNGGRLLVEGSQPMTACANIVALSTSTRRPSWARRRHVKSWLTDSPFRRAVADTCRGAP